MPKDWFPGLLKELLKRFYKEIHIRIFGVKKMGACLVERNEATPGRRYKDRQCTYNVTSRRVALPLLPWKNNKYYPSTFRIWVLLSYSFYTESACIVWYSHVICALSGCTVFFHITSEIALFSEEKVIELEVHVLIFSLSRNFFNLRRIQRWVIINVRRTSCKVQCTLFFADFNWNWTF
jgi:hypothetical protein